MRYVLAPLAPILVFLAGLFLMTQWFLAYPALIFLGGVCPYLLFRSNRRRLSRVNTAPLPDHRRISGIRGYLKQYPLERQEGE